ncbi:MAG: twin-arginine translocase TatA/TatE family subunit [Anaerolineales bacterium]|jgi:sec-independent protein translocase protein TatA
MFGIQPIHIVIIVLVALLIFGPKRLPEIGRGIGRAINEFRQGTREMTAGFQEEVGKPSVPQTIAPPAASKPVVSPAIPSVPAQGAPGPVGGNFCVQCGAPNVPEARFCSNCGSQLPKKSE